MPPSEYLCIVHEGSRQYSPAKIFTMRTQLLNLTENSDPLKDIQASISFVPFARFIEEKIASGKGMRIQQLQLILDRIKGIPGWDGEIDPARIEDYEEILELIHITLSAPIMDEHEEFWALAIPFKPQLFFGTSALYDFLQTPEGQVNTNMLDQQGLEEKKLSRLNTIYGLALQKLYGLPAGDQNHIIHHFRDEATGLNKYFRLDFDARFVDIRYEGELPEISFESLHLADDSRYGALDVLQRFLPLDQMYFSGFSMIRIKDVTQQYIIEHIKDIIVNLSPGQMVYNDITAGLKELMGNNFLDVSLMPVIKVNGKLVTNCFEGMDKSMQQICSRYNMPMQGYIDSIERYSRTPEVIFRKNVGQVMEGEDALFPILREMGVEGLVVLPIFFQKQLVGILTIYSRQKEALNEHMLSALEPAIPLLEQLLQTTIDDFQITLDNAVKEKFTSLQPAVEWRFNEVAFDYLQNRKTDPRAEVAQVYFSDVHPLYGAVDIRNSTLERNNALRLDMQRQLELLTDVLQRINSQRELGLTNELIFKSRKWLSQIDEFISSDDEFQLNIFFEEEVAPFLLHFRQTNPATREMIDRYFIAIGPNGEAHTNRRALEQSLQMLNRTIGNLLDQMNVEIQATYPCYFEKFRSDGVEYDIYIGQSITPDKEYHPLYLRNLRLWQLNSMAIIARLTKVMQAGLPRKLETTQLIFVHANTIDISFRNDEHRFDVEGSYNIRYEMIKKRIDKVLIKNSNERLTQPGKIALVYFQPKDVEEYISHIHYLQDQQILDDEIEFLELEELQGVSGLKALRVTVLAEDADDVISFREDENQAEPVAAGL